MRANVILPPGTIINRPQEKGGSYSIPTSSFLSDLSEESLKISRIYATQINLNCNGKRFLHGTETVLTGITDCREPIDDDPMLRDLFKIAFTILRSDEISSIVSTNYLTRNDPALQFDTVTDADQYSRNLYKELEKVRTTYQSIDDIARKTLQSKLGLCGEISCVYLNELKKKHPSLRAEMVAVKGGDHVFIILNLDSKIQNREFKVKEAGSRALFVDMWAQSIASVNQKGALCDFRGHMSLLNPNFTPPRVQVLPMIQDLGQDQLLSIWRV